MGGEAPSIGLGMVADGYDDCKGDILILSRVRPLVRPQESFPRGIRKDRQRVHLLRASPPGRFRVNSLSLITHTPLTIT